MVFSSLIFLFAYLPLTLAAYYVFPRKWRNVVLFVLSLLFYGWGEPVYLILMTLSILLGWIALLGASAAGLKAKRKRK